VNLNILQQCKTKLEEKAILRIKKPTKDINRRQIWGEGIIRLRGIS
jgi:hypothetical protein